MLTRWWFRRGTPDDPGERGRFTRLARIVRARPAALDPLRTRELPSQDFESAWRSAFKRRVLVMLVVRRALGRRHRSPARAAAGVSARDAVGAGAGISRNRRFIPKPSAATSSIATARSWPIRWTPIRSRPIRSLVEDAASTARRRVRRARRLRRQGPRRSRSRNCPDRAGSSTFAARARSRPSRSIASPR